MPAVDSLRPSYLNGFAPRDGYPLNPGLWQGCVVALDPGLGITGNSTLYDWSGLGNHGTITNLASTGWVVGECGYALEFNATSDYLKVPYNPTLAHTRYSWSIWVKSTETFTNRGLIGRWQNENGGEYSWAITWENTALYWYQRGLSGCSSGALNQNDGKWHHLAGTYEKTTTQFWFDGVAKGSIANNGNYTASFSSLVIGNYALSQGQPTDWDGQWRSAAVWNRAITHNEVRTLATDPAAMYRIAPRSYRAVVATNRRRRMLLGAF
jgi:hypothetical protein